MVYGRPFGMANRLNTDMATKSNRKRENQEMVSSSIKRQRVSDNHFASDNSSDDSYNIEMDYNTAIPAAGTIKGIKLTNFMCHSNLEISFSDCVNFIIGRNGSGKSAVLTAISVGLGAKANVTDRGNSLRNLVKTGCSTAIIRIKLTNGGDGAYRKDIFGNEIMVERRISVNEAAVSCYKLFNEFGQLIFNKKQELIRLLDYFNIQVDNPIVVLNQDKSRAFLHSSKESMKYQFFKNATNLTQIEDDYNFAKCKKEEVAKMLDTKKELLPVMERQLHELSLQIKESQAVGSLQDKVNSLKNEAAWAFVTEQEKGVDLMRKEIRQCERKIPQFHKKIDELKATIQDAKSQYSRICKQIESSNSSIQQLESKRTDVQAKLDKHKSEQQKIYNERNQCKSEVDTIAREKKQLLQKIMEIEQRNRNEFDVARESKQKKIEQVSKVIESLESQFTKYTSITSTLSSRKDELFKKLEEFRIQKASDLSKMDPIRRNISHMEAAKSNHLLKFDRKTPEIFIEIDNQDFKRKPLGPLGNLIQLADSKYAIAVEHCLGLLLTSYLCDNFDDQKKLSNIFKNLQVKPKPNIIVQPFINKVYDTSRYSPPPKFTTVLSVLQSSDYDVLNCLIDQRKIESTVLFNNTDEGLDWVQNKTVPNCVKGITLRGDEIFVNKYYPQPNKNVTVRYLAVSLESQIESEKRTLDQLKQSLNTLSQRENEAEVEFDNIDASLDKYSAKNKNLEYEKSVNIAQKESLEKEFRLLCSEENVAVLKEEVEISEQQLAHRSKDFEELNKKFQSQKTVTTELSNSRNEIVSSIQQLLSPLEKHEEELESFNQIKTSSEQQLLSYNTRLQEFESTITEKSNVLSRLEQDLNDSLDKATQLCSERIETRRTVKNIENEINQIFIRIKAEKEIRGDPVLLQDKYTKLKTSYIEKKQLFDSATHLLCKLREMVVSRRRAFISFRLNMASRANHTFKHRLSLQGFSGDIVFDHKNHTLTITSCPNKPNKVTPGSNKQLSGGERSFTTICFILALWQSIEAPFRCLDEFDVYMDMVNRRISMDFLLKYANDTKTFTQFIFLTPLNMTNIASRDNVTIFRMPDPDRNQLTLDENCRIQNPQN